jgi:4-hydroxy-4-methyl-2-oxoglutarate aldolase
MRYRAYDAVLERCYAAVLMDIMDAMGAREQSLDPGVRPLKADMRVWGEAVTMLLKAVDEPPERPFQLEMEVLDDLQPGQVIVAQCDAPRLSAFWGGLLSNAAVGRGGAGVVTDGGARDYAEIVSLGFPVFCRGLTPYDSQGRMDGTARDVAIMCGGVRVAPGDLVFGDTDGVVVVPAAMAEEVIRRASEKVRGEDTVREELRRGASMVETFRKYGIL